MRAVAICAALMAAPVPEPAAAQPLFDVPAYLVFDAIDPGDPSSLICVSPAGEATVRAYDRRYLMTVPTEVRLWVAEFVDGPDLTVAVAADIAEDRADALARAMAGAAGRLPDPIRYGVAEAVILSGDDVSLGEDARVIYHAGDVERLLGLGQLDEMVFHDATHAAWAAQHNDAAAWVAAQAADGRTLTPWAETAPDWDDLAETAYFAFALRHRADRVPPADAAALRAAAPARIAYIDALIPAPYLTPGPGGPAMDCEVLLS